MFATSSPSVSLGECSDQEIADAIGQLHALEQSVRSRRLAFVAEYDRRQAWKPDGARSMSGWLAEMRAFATEAMMDVSRVGDAVVQMASLPLDTNILFMTIMATKMPFVGRG